ncbi:related to monocarboxylate transporter 2 [Rhynchosporium agropyri]|uniref:Related to monocarboxylate transporter 2 n=1 Tax=Rhynchosporium agropyri TaxID=914238 RepID=A0A1E1LI14_9HELO|nr:related to monocarboxylate transporter 2 [Rhynchosporium agropyri]
MRIWAAIIGGSSILATFLIPAHPSSLSTSTPRTRRISWKFLRHRTLYIYSVAIILQSCGYGIPQTYLNTYAHDVAQLSQTSATLLLTLFNIPGIASSAFFGYLSDKKHYRLSATTVTSISAISSALSAFLFWGLTSQGSMALLVLFSISFGFFAGGYSGTWGGVINELESEAAQCNEAIDTGMLYGILNGAKGIGYVSGGLAGVALLKIGSGSSTGGFAYGTSYGPLIMFTGLSSVFGGRELLWKWKKVPGLLRCA